MRFSLPGLVSRLLRKTVWRGLLLGFGISVLVLAAWQTGLFTPWERVTWDWRAQFWAEPGPNTGKIKVVVLDQASLDWAQRFSGLGWPWPRQAYIHIIDYLSKAGAKAIIFDLLFTEASSLAGDDKALAKVMANSQKVAGALMLTSESGSAVLPDWAMPVLPQIKGQQKWLRASSDRQSKRILLPIKILGQKMLSLGNVAENPDPDQVVRRVTLVKGAFDQAVLSLGAAAYAALSERKAVLKENSLDIGHLRAPLDEKGRAVLRFRGGPGVHEKFSAASIIQSELRLLQGKLPTIRDSSVFKDCYVFFGLTAPGLHDMRATPVSAVYPGVEIHATALDNLISGDFIKKAPSWAVFAWVFFLCLGSAFAGSFFQAVRHNVIFFALLLPVPIIIGFLAYPLGYWWPIMVAEAGVLLVLLAVVFLNLALVGEQKRFIKKAFNHYLSPVVIERILEDPDQLRLGGERRELTILFSDLAGFTSLSEGLDPQELTHLLNDYLSEMSEFILAAGGTLDKYEGDAIIAFWNAPLSQPDHALAACRAALKCNQRLLQRAPEYEKRLGRALWARIGINTGPVVVGNMGSRQRFDYTVLGDAANLASRLEGANKVFGTPLMVSEDTWKQTRGELRGRKLGRLKVVGRRESVVVYQPLAKADRKVSHEMEVFAQGLDLVEKRKWQAALSCFKTIETDPAAKAYIHKLSQLASESPDAWDGVWNLTNK